MKTICGDICAVCGRANKTLTTIHLDGVMDVNGNILYEMEDVCDSCLEGHNGYGVCNYCDTPHLVPEEDLNDITWEENGEIRTGYVCDYNSGDFEVCEDCGAFFPVIFDYFEEDEPETMCLNCRYSR